MFSKLATSEELQRVNKHLDTMQKTLDVHTAALEKLLTDKKVKGDNNTVSAESFDRLEQWAVQVSNKLGIRLEL